MPIYAHPLDYAALCGITILDPICGAAYRSGNITAYQFQKNTPYLSFQGAMREIFIAAIAAAQENA
jgi:hypothetical protein